MHFRALATGIAAVAAAATAIAQNGRPMTIEDLLLAVRVTHPQVTADGKLLAYVRTTTDLKVGRRNGDIWVGPTSGASAPKLLAGGEKGESAPQFSADGRKLAFISTRGGAAQAFVMDVEGGEPRQITKLAAGVQPPLVFSPDGSKVAFVSDVPIEPEEQSPVKAHRLRRLMFRHWDEWRVGVRHHIFVADLDGGREPVDVTPGDFDSPPHFYEDGGIAFSPDGAEIAFVSNREGGDREAWTTNRDVWIVPAAGGQAKKLTATNTAADETPAFSPDGKFVAVRSQRRAGFEADRWYLDIYDRATASKRTLFETQDLSVLEFTYAPDGASIWFTAAEKGTHSLYVVPVTDGAPRLVAKGGAISAPRAGRGIVVYSKSSMTSPADIFALDVGGNGYTRQITRENATLAKEVAWPTPESATVAGAGGTPVQYWVLKPPGFDPSRKYPAVFLIHGGPQGAWDDAWSSRWNPALWAAQGWVIVAPNPRGSTGFGQTFVDEISQDWSGKVMVDLEAVFDTASRLPYVDGGRMAIAGASYGGYAVNWIIAHSDRFKAAVSHDGVFNLESMALTTEELWFSEWEFGGPAWSETARQNFAKASPHLHVSKIKTPTLVITNELDFRVPVDQGLQLFTALRRNGVPSEALVFPDEGHWVLQPLNSKRWHEVVFGWLNKNLGASHGPSQ
ncbi:MAG TPA: S9 family peptidase [Vicinamibacterales bacterium]|nr:S9 family peptidase [Vicinamibacterales bacterium]